MPQLILATQSPRRMGLARQMGLRFTTAAAEIDEMRRTAETPVACVQRLAEAKARQVSALHPTALVLGADTVVVLNGEVLGKPADAADATAMLRRLSGRTHVVYTGLCLLRADPPWHETAYADTQVTFRSLQDEEIAFYVTSGEPLDKAGAYGIQGRAAMFVERIEGCHVNVVGLPLALCERMLYRAGIRWWSSLPPTGPAPAVEPLV